MGGMGGMGNAAGVDDMDGILGVAGGTIGRAQACGRPPDSTLTHTIRPMSRASPSATHQCDTSRTADRPAAATATETAMTTNSSG